MAISDVKATGKMDSRIEKNFSVITEAEKGNLKPLKDKVKKLRENLDMLQKKYPPARSSIKLGTEKQCVKEARAILATYERLLAGYIGQN